MKSLTKLALVLALTTVPLAPAASFTVISQPDAAYLAATTLIPVTDPDFTALNSITDGVLTVNFSAPVEARTVPGSWSTWSSPPFSETSTPRTLWTQSRNLIALNFSSVVQTFGFEAEPNAFVINPFTADFYNGATLVGSIVQNVDGNGGARLFAASSITGFDSVVITSTSDFAFAQLRYGEEIPPVPEPATMALVGVGLMGVLAKRRARK